MENGTLKKGQIAASPLKADVGDSIEHVKFSYEQVKGWIENADNKVSVSCAIFTGAFGIITFMAGKADGVEAVKECWHIIYLVTFIFSLFLFMLSLLEYVLAVNPNLGSSGKNNKKYLLYYGDIEKTSVKEYRAIIKKASENDFLDELLLETHYNSGICLRKMQRYKKGLWLSFASVILAILSLTVKYLMFR
jgi:hypothetical protein